MTIEMRMMAPRTAAAVAHAMRIASLRVLSMVSMLRENGQGQLRRRRQGCQSTHSFEKRFMMRPMGVVSKKDMGACMTP